VIVRNRPALVRSIAEHTHPSLPALHEVQVDYIDNWSHPDSDYLIWELERGTKVYDSLAMPRIEDQDQTPDKPALLQAFLYANQWSAVNRLAAHREDDEHELRLISPWQSAVQVEDYQLYPVLKALLMPRISLLLADDVGLGKTIETGLILSELFVRRRIRRVLIICPASLQLQWRDEMREKFHLDFTIVDREETFKLQRELGVDSNPWASYPRIITSMDYLRQKDILASFRGATHSLSGHFDALLPWQMLIVDEVHNLAPANYGDDSDRCEMLRSISPFFEHRIFLSATPHNGYTVSFTGLLELLDPVRFQQKAHVDPEDQPQIELTMVRRLKTELTEEGEPERFPKRTVDALEVTLHPAEKELFEALRAYRRALHALLGRKSKRERHLGEFLIKLLTKRLLSSSYAFARTWWRHVEGLQDQEENLDVTVHSIERAQMVMNDDQEKGLREEDAMKQTGAWLRRYAEELTIERQQVNTCLERLGWSEQVIDLTIKDQSLTIIPLPPDARWECLLLWINNHLKQGHRLRDDERLILFTEYKHTLDYILERLRREGLVKPQVECLYGGASGEQREAIKDAFNDPRHPLRILVGTDTVSEGISLQMTCRYVIHQDIPWNPMRLEQRNGRVDRHGQERAVSVFHFSSNDEADLKFIEAVVKKVDTARADLGSVGQVIDQTVEEYFTTGLSSALPAQDELERRVQEARGDAQDTRDMGSRDRGSLAACVRAMQRLNSTEMQMGLSSEHAAQLLLMAVEHEGGCLEEIEQGKAYRLKMVPKTWKKLVKETIERQNGSSFSLPKLVFDPAYFEEWHDGRCIFKPRIDAELIRLGHPLIQRAIGVLRRRMWDGKGLHRWTLQHSELPAGTNVVLLLPLFLEVTNQFREVAHQEMLLCPFEVRGYRLYPLEPALWDELKRLPRFSLEEDELEQHTQRIHDWWLEHRTVIRDFILQKGTAYQQDFTQRMQQRFQEEHRHEQSIFTGRVKELEQQKQPAHVRALQRELERQKQKIQKMHQQPALFADLEAERQQKQTEAEQLTKELEFTLYVSNYVDRMKDLVTREQERILTKVLPRRYALATVDVQPLAVEYLVRSTRKEQK